LPPPMKRLKSSATYADVQSAFTDLAHLQEASRALTICRSWESSSLKNVEEQKSLSLDKMFT
jgi:hypothetical protein